MRKVQVVVRATKPVAAQPRTLTAEEQATLAEVKASLYTALLMHRLTKA